MSDEWIIDVLNDLQRFARRKGLTVTAAELEEVCLVAMAELSEKAAGDTGGVVLSGHGSGTGESDRVAGRRGVA